jgi:hypothetical protein
VLGLVERGRGGLDVGVLVERVGDRLVHPLGVDAGHDAVLALVDVLAPDERADGHGGVS